MSAAPANSIETRSFPTLAIASLAAKASPARTFYIAYPIHSIRGYRGDLKK